MNWCLKMLSFSQWKLGWGDEFYQTLKKIIIQVKKLFQEIEEGVFSNSLMSPDYITPKSAKEIRRRLQNNISPE